MNKILLFNPFQRIAGLRALVLGVSIMFLTAIVAYFSRTHFDGALDAHMGADSPFFVYIIEFLIAWLSVVFVFYFTGILMSSSKIRGIDILGTTALARHPFFWVALLGFSMPEMNLSDLLSGDISTRNMGLLTFISILMLAFIIWYVFLLYRAFTISANLKGNRATVGFIIALLAAEVLSLIIFHFLYPFIL